MRLAKEVGLEDSAHPTRSTSSHRYFLFLHAVPDAADAQAAAATGAGRESADIAGRQRHRLSAGRTDALIGMDQLALAEQPLQHSGGPVAGLRRRHDERRIVQPFQGNKADLPVTATQSDLLAR